MSTCCVSPSLISILDLLFLPLLCRRGAETQQNPLLNQMSWRQRWWGRKLNPDFPTPVFILLDYHSPSCTLEWNCSFLSKSLHGALQYAIVWSFIYLGVLQAYSVPARAKISSNILCYVWLVGEGWRLEWWCSISEIKYHFRKENYSTCSLEMRSWKSAA